TPTLAGDETDKEDLDGDGELDDESSAVIVHAADAAATPKKRTRRGRRGAKKPKSANASGSSDVKANANGKGKEKDSEKEKEKEETQVPQPPTSLIVTSAAMPVTAPSPSLNVSDTVLGYGSHGTVVYRGSLQGRAVAVKRLLADFVTLASREVSILQESDDHPNVVRYYYQEAHTGFLYIALELCPASLADLIETPDRDAWRDIAVSFDPKRALKQVTNGLRHLHGLKLVHRDIKPQNILVSAKGAGTSSGSLSSASGGAGGRGANYRMLISDFGLCKKLDVDQTSFLPTAHGAMAAGTVGWRAPGILRGEVKLDEGLSDDQSMSSRGSTATINGNASISSTSSNNSNSGKGRTRLTKSVDIFALGCLYYYTLTSGGHPFGDRYEREVNIFKNEKNLKLLERFGEEGTEAADLIEGMLDSLPSESNREAVFVSRIYIHACFDIVAAQRPEYCAGLGW
ncbi:kinase-like protein, partial [Macrolepiota fuliginosa MF-IS2]